jgi:hypothetical protein
MPLNEMVIVLVPKDQVTLSTGKWTGSVDDMTFHVPTMLESDEPFF